MDEQESSNEYFANLKPDLLGNEIIRRVRKFKRFGEASGWFSQITASYLAYHGASAAEGRGGFLFDKRLRRGGLSGQLTLITVNQMRPILQHVLSSATRTRITFDALANNSDTQSMAEAELANSILDYQFRERGMQRAIHDCAEYSLAMSEGWVMDLWDVDEGEMVREQALRDASAPPDFTLVDEATGEEMPNAYMKTRAKGDIRYSVHPPVAVCRDIQRRDTEHDWLAVECVVNKYDLAATFPEYKDEILATSLQVNAFTNEITNRLLALSYVDTVESDSLTYLYRFFNRRQPACPDGRYAAVLSTGKVLMASPLPCRKLPVHPMIPSRVLETPIGYSQAFDMLPMQELYNAVWSTIVSRVQSFGLQNVLVPKGSDLRPSWMSGGLRFLQYKPTAAGEPKVLDLMQLSGELVSLPSIIERLFEMVSGVNSVVRGQPQDSLKSGAALALVQSTFLEFNNAFVASLVSLCSALGTSTIEWMQDQADEERVVSIVGKGKRPYVKYFTGANLKGISRINIDLGNQLRNTAAGRFQLAEMGVQAGLVKTPEMLTQALTSGTIEPAFQKTQSETFYIEQENEMLREGQVPLVSETDNHLMHLTENSTPLDSDDARRNPAVASAVMQHLNSHIETWRASDPALLASIGIPPAPPPNDPRIVALMAQIGMEKQQIQAGATGAPANGNPTGPGGAPGFESVLDRNSGQAQMPNLPNMPQAPGGSPEPIV